MKRLLVLFFALTQLPSMAQYQVQKGHWFISHQAGSYLFTKETFKQYRDGELDGSVTYKDHGFDFAFTGPDWGYMQTLTSKRSDEINNTHSKSSRAEIWLQPQVGYFVQDNLMIGANVLMGYQTDKYSDSYDERGKGHYWALGLGPVLKYYFGKHARQKPFAGFESRFEFAKEKDENWNEVEKDIYKTKESRYMIRPFAGYAWFLGKRWTVDGRIQYNYVKGTTERTSWYYEDGELATYSPQTDKTNHTVHSIGVSFGISYTF